MAATSEYVIVNGEALELMDDGRFPVYYHFPENTRLFDALCCPPRLVPLEEEGDEKGVTLFRLVPHAPYFAYSVAGPRDQVLARRIIPVGPLGISVANGMLNGSNAAVLAKPNTNTTEGEGNGNKQPQETIAEKKAALLKKLATVAPRSTNDDVYSAIPQTSFVFPASRSEFIGHKLDSLLRCATSGRPPIQNEDGSFTFNNMLDRRNRAEVSAFRNAMEQTDQRGLHRYVIVHGLPPSTTAENVGKYFEAQSQYVFDSDVCLYEDPTTGRKHCRSTAFAELKDLDMTFRFLLERYLPYNDGLMYVVGSDRKPVTDVPRLEPFPTAVGPAPHREHIEPPRRQQPNLHHHSNNFHHGHNRHEQQFNNQQGLAPANGPQPFGGGSDRHQHNHSGLRGAVDPSGPNGGGGRFYNNNNMHHNKGGDGRYDAAGLNERGDTNGGRMPYGIDRRRGGGGEPNSVNNEYGPNMRMNGPSSSSGFNGQQANPNGFNHQGNRVGPRGGFNNANGGGTPSGGSASSAQPPIRDTRESRTSEPLHAHLASNSSTSSNSLQTPTSANAINQPLPRQHYSSLQQSGANGISKGNSPTNSTPTSLNSAVARDKGSSVIYCIGHISEHVVEASVQDRVFMPSKRAYDGLLQHCSNFANVYLIVIYDRHPMVFGIAKITGRAGIAQLSAEWVAPNRNLKARDVPHKLVQALGIGEIDSKTWYDGLRLAESGEEKLTEGPFEACQHLHEYVESCPARPETAPSTPTSAGVPSHAHGHHGHNGGDRPHNGGHHGGPYFGGGRGNGQYSSGFHHSNSFAPHRQNTGYRRGGGSGPHAHAPSQPVAL